jgi:hypothetical protein
LLQSLDRELRVPSELHCFGGFVVAEHYGLIRPTADVDILDMHPAREDRDELVPIGAVPRVVCAVEGGE